MVQPVKTSGTKPLIQIAIGLVIGLVGFGVPLAFSACGGGAQRLPAIIACQLAALKVLPEDRGMITVNDGIDLWERIEACKRVEHKDGGT